MVKILLIIISSVGFTTIQLWNELNLFVALGTYLYIIQDLNIINTAI